MTDRAPDKKTGFTLLEALVALAILAVALTVLFGLFANGISLTRKGEAALASSELAQSLADRIGKDLPLRDGEISGETPEGLQWTVRIESFGDAADHEAWPLVAKRVLVQVAAEGTEQLTLVTLRLGPKETNP